MHHEDVFALLVERQLVQVRHDPGYEAVYLNLVIAILFEGALLLFSNLGHYLHTPLQEHRRLQSFAVVDGVRAAGDLLQHLVRLPFKFGFARDDAVVRAVARAEGGGRWTRLDDRILNIVVVFLHYPLEMLAIRCLGWQQVWVQLDEVDR